MGIYRLYFLDQNADVLQVVELAQENDESAAQIADQHPGPYARKELWQSARLVRGWTNSDA